MLRYFLVGWYCKIKRKVRYWVLTELTTSDIESLTKLISEYSVLIVACAILLLAFIAILTVMLKQNQKNMKIITDLNKQLVDKFLTEDENSDKTADEEKNLVVKHVQLNDELQKQLKIMRDKTDCDRTYIFLFHNGEHTLNMFPFLKVTCFIEWKLYTVKQTMTDQRAIPVSILNTLCTNLLNKDKYMCGNLDDIQEVDPMLYAWLKSKGAKSFFSRALKDDNKNLIGFVACDYVDTEYDKVTTLKQIEDSLRICSIIVSPLMRVG